MDGGGSVARKADELARWIPDRPCSAAPWLRRAFGAALDDRLRSAMEGFEFWAFKAALWLGADPTVEASIGVDYPLATRAARSGDARFLGALLDFGARVDAGLPAGALLPLHMAAIKGAEETAKLLLDRGADPSARFLNFEGAEAKSKKGWSPLVCACKHGKVEVAKLLLERGADPDDSDDAGASVLEICRRGRFEALERLLQEHGARDLRAPAKASASEG